MTSDARAVGRDSYVHAQARDAVAGPCRRPLKGGRSPSPSEGQKSLQLEIQDWLGLLGLTLSEQIIEEPSQADQAPAFFAEEEQQAIAACCEVVPTGGVDVSEGHGGRSAGLHFQAVRGHGPATIPGCAASCGTTVSKPRGMAPILDDAPQPEEACERSFTVFA
jgi:hypothetical protein